MGADPNTGATSDHGLLRKIFFIREGDMRAKAITEKALMEIVKWLDAGHSFDIVIEKREMIE